MAARRSLRNRRVATDLAAAYLVFLILMWQLEKTGADVDPRRRRVQAVIAGADYL